MASSGDLIDFEVIENQKENIQSIPGGRSAKQLLLLCSPLAAKQPAPFTQTQDLKNTIRQEFEKELLNIDDADDPLDIFDRYVKWTMDAYPTAQATAESGLLPLVERATKTFLSCSMYKNDPRYLKMWLRYIKLFSDAPRETYAFLAKNGIGEGLALYYEEYAAWLEAQARWSQAEEVFVAGVDKEARPKERLLRKYAEFQHRQEAKGTGGDGPNSPALPRIRPALAAKSDPFAGPFDEQDPQAGDRVAAQATAARSGRPGRAKMAIFTDDDSSAAQTSSDGQPSGPGWGSIGSLSERRKENIREPSSWAGEKLDGGKRLGGPKLEIFKDPFKKIRNENISLSSANPDLQRATIDARGRRQYVYADLESIYPNGVGGMVEEFCFEELRARHRGWLDRDWPEIEGAVVQPARDLRQRHDSDGTCHLNLPAQDMESKIEEPLIGFSDEEECATKAPVMVPLKLDSPVAVSKKARREEKANRTRKIKIMQVEVKQETQTVQINLDSPSGPTKVRKRKPEATMTIHTKEAMNEVYDIFNQPLNPTGSDTTAEDEEPEESDDDEDDDYTSAGDSTGTGHISAGVSEYGDETTGDFTASSRVDADTESVTQQTATGSDFSEYTNTNATGLSDAGAADDEELSWVDIPVNAAASEESTVHAIEDQAEVEGVTPTSPRSGSSLDYFEASNHEDADGINQPVYRRGRAVGRLPFMTPIVEKTESSIGAMTVGAERSLASMKTPSRQNQFGNMADIEDSDEGSPLSSPFQENFDDKEKVNGKIAPPALQQLSVRAKQAVEESIRHTEIEVGEPIINDSQCNPIDSGIRKTVLAKIYPPLETYQGFFSSTGSVASQGGEIRKYAKGVGKKAVGNETIGAAPVLEFGRCNRTYIIRRELGRGAFAPVYLVDSEALETGVQRGWEGQRNKQEVVKMEEPATAWEFYMIRQAKRRLGVSRPSESIVAAHEMHMFDDEGFLIEEYRSQGTLLEAINIWRAESNGGIMDEQLAFFFAIELFRTVEGLHSKGIIHGDLKADNVLIRFEGGNEAAWNGQYRRDGSEGWSQKGILLIDFGRGIDMRVFKAAVQFIADWKTTEADCAEMREMRPWTFQVDYHGLAGILHSLLFGKYMETAAELGGGLGGGPAKTFKIKEGLKRYWQTEIWSECFEVLLNPLMHVDGEEGKKLPITNHLRILREKMETFLEAHSDKGVGLKGLVRRLDMSLKEKRR